MYIDSSAITSNPVSLLASTKVSAFSFIVGALLPVY